MTKVIRLTESQLIKLIKNVISEQARGGTDPEVLQAIADMNFTKDACRKEKISAPELVHEYCNTTYPNIMISYTLDGLELLDRKNMKIIKVWEGFTEKDIPELEKYVKMSTI
jgi:hypothetical protein